MMGSCEKWKPYAPLALRIGLGIIFIYHGYGKVFGAAGLGTGWNPQGMPAIVQVLVAWGELLGGLAVLLGFLTCLGAAIIVVIMLGAIAIVHWPNGFNIMNMGFEYNFALIMMALSLILSGPGPLSIDSKCCKK